MEMVISGRVVAFLAVLLSLASVIMLSLVYVGQINSGPVPRRISMVKIGLSGYRDALIAAFGNMDPIDGLYASNPTAPLGASNGLREEYKFGLRSYCGYLDGNKGVCGHTAAITRFRPYTAITSDMALNYSQFSNAVIPVSGFQNENALGSISRTTCYTFLLGFIFAILAMIAGSIQHTATFMFAFVFAIFSSLLLAMSAGMWNAIVKKAGTINGLSVPIPNPVPLGIIVSAGSGLGLTWASFGCMLFATLLYMMICCTYRG